MGSILNFVFDTNTPLSLEKREYNGSDNRIFQSSAILGFVYHMLLEKGEYSYTLNSEIDNSKKNIIVYECQSELNDIIKNKETNDIDYEDNELIKLSQKYPLSDKVKLLISCISEPTSYIDEFEYNLLKVCKLHNININNIIFVDSNFKITFLKNIKSKYVPHFIFDGGASFAEILESNNDYLNDLNYISTLSTLGEARTTLDRKYTFISLNRSNWKVHRTLIGCLFNHLKSDKILWSFINKPNQYHKNSEDSLMEGHHEATEYIRKIFYDNIDSIDKISPKEIDTFKSDNKFGFRTSDTFDKTISLSTYFDIVTESSFQYDAIFFTEKIIKPIVNLHPFIVISNNGYLKYFREYLGFKTFDCIFDESYDEIEDPYQRIEFIFKEIIKILEKPQEELNQMYKKAFDVCKYNRNRLLEVYSNKNEHILNLFEEIENEWNLDL